MPGTKRKGGAVYVSSRMVPAPGSMRVVKRYKRSGAFAPSRALARRSTRKGETEYFDCGINTVVTFAGTTWADTEVPCDNYITGAGLVDVYTDATLIPTAIGTSYGGVDGQKYNLQKVRVRGRLSVPVLSDQADVTQGTNVRVMLVEDTRPNGAQAQGETVMQDMGETAENIHSFQRVADNIGRFRILKDLKMVLPVSAVGTDGASTNSVAFDSRNFKLAFMPRGGREVLLKIGSSTPTVASTINCNIFMLAAAERNGVAIALTVVACSRAYYNEV